MASWRCQIPRVPRDYGTFHLAGKRLDSPAWSSRASQLESHHPNPTGAFQAIWKPASHGGVYKTEWHRPFFPPSLFCYHSHPMASNTSQNQSVLEDGRVRPGIYMIVNIHSHTFADILDTKELCCRPEPAIAGKGRVCRISHPPHVLIVGH